MVTLEYAEFLAGQANGHIRVIGDRLVIFIGGVEAGSTLITDRCVSEYAVRRIISRED